MVPYAVTLRKTWEIYETIVSDDNGAEYGFIAKGKTAAKAFDILKDLPGKVVRLKHVKVAFYKDQAQIEAMEDFEALVVTKDSKFAAVAKQKLKTVALSKTIGVEDGARVCLCSMCNPDDVG